jgi:hypothetical protein
MTKEKSRYLEDEELLGCSAPWDLTGEELDRLLYLQREIQNGVWEPGQITAPDVTDCMKEWGIIPDDYINPTKEEEDNLHKILLNNWNSLSKPDKEMYHFLNGTLPRWGKLEPPSEEFMKYYNEQIDKP